MHRMADVDDVVGDHAEPDPTVHSGVTLVSASVETVPPLGDADASLAAGPPLLAVAEPALPLLTLALGTLGRAVGNADPFYALGFRCCLVLGRVDAASAATMCGGRPSFARCVSMAAISRSESLGRRS